MAHQVLYREWRPKVFDEVVEQKHAVYALRQSVISGQIAHAYLFSGTRGTGKTTLAKIFARAINCLHPEDGNPCNQCAICRGMLDGSLMDIVEMDAASNNSVDNIRRLCDEIVFMPSQAKYKVYIIDEVHMLSAGAFNALLKTLEEPPAHAVFILATTEPHRIPATILSRCQRYEFRRLPVASMAARLAEIARTDRIDASPEALQAMASLADGALRDAISLLDQARASFPGRIERDDVLSLAGVVQDEFMQRMADALLCSDAPALLDLIDQLVMAGRDLPRFITDLAQFFRNILVCQVSDHPEVLVRASSEALAIMKKTAGRVTGSQLVDLIKGLSALLSDLRWAADGRTALEIGLIRLMGPQQDGNGSRQAAVPSQTPSQTPPGSKIPEKKEPSPAIPSPAPAAKAIEEIPAPAVLSMASAIEKADEEASAQTLEIAMVSIPEAGASLSSDQAAADLWQSVLDALVNDGQMTLYLFCRSARPHLDGHVLKLAFAVADQISCREAGQPASLKVLRSAAQRLAGREIDIQVVLDNGRADSAAAGSSPQAPEVPPDDWISKIRRAAETCGIPIKLEE
jgi:DNA polymerase III subunit gamma/tau